VNQIVPPNSIDVEKVVLASMMQGDEEITEYGCDQLTVAEFYNSNNQIVFKCIQDMVKSSVGAMDSVLVQDAISGLDGMDDTSSVLVIADLIGVQTTSSIVKHCEVLREDAESRHLLNLSYQMQNSIIKGEKSAVIKESVDVELLSMEGTETVKTIHISEAIPETMDQIEGKSEEYKPMYYGYKDLDDITGGILPGEIVVIGARPGMTKTGFSLDVVLNNARADTRTLVFSLEMTNSQLVSRYITNIGRVSNTKIRHRSLTKNDYPNIEKALTEISNLPIHLNDNGQLNSNQIRAEVRRFKRKNPDLKLVMIDYLQLMEETIGGDSGTRLSINLNMKILRLLAKQEGIGIVILSQLNRKCEERKNPHKRPVLSDLKESGNIEQDAHQILFLYRGYKYDEVIDDVPVRENELEVIAAKIREGSPGTAKLLFEGEYSSFNGVDGIREEPEMFGGSNDYENEFVRGM
jgi:replicative DNA helicase|tara:strand:- start:11679 stop:13070 length:1392 start_codon:yes stop_codon:yes gene_type:complete